MNTKRWLALSSEIRAVELRHETDVRNAEARRHRAASMLAIVFRGVDAVDFGNKVIQDALDDYYNARKTHEECVRDRDSDTRTLRGLLAEAAREEPVL